ncbi:hypothetical protein D9M70_493680 [compost metagenome]
MTLTLDQELRLALAAAELFQAGRFKAPNQSRAVRMTLMKARKWTAKGFALENYPALQRLQLSRRT